MELAYLPTVADAAAAIRVRKRATPAGRLQNWVIIASGVVVLQALVVAFMSPRGPNPRLIVLCLTALALIVGVYLLVPTLQGRQIHRMLAPQGEFRAVVDSSGVRVASRDTDTTYRWPMLTRYAETDALFVLMTPDKYGVGFVVLPKRGAADPEDIDRLRGLLTGHATRVWPKVRVRAKERARG
ncbi:YcxB family protein [Streptomyces sp. NPDC059649]|uniref:YcxB family protein n=1 Tax=Streptomyces sp. NPDC059649 TaxID=3346895 RepID=UPI003699DA2B